MGIFDKMFGKGATYAEKQPNAPQRFDELKRRYEGVLRGIDQEQVRLRNLHVENDKLFIRGVAPSQEAKNKVWDQIKLVNPKFDDITVEIEVRPIGVPATGGAMPKEAGERTYTVKSGDTLSKISRQFYGDANEYMQIFYANRDKLNDPDKIQVGQVLRIPEENV